MFHGTHDVNKLQQLQQSQPSGLMMHRGVSAYTCVGYEQTASLLNADALQNNLSYKHTHVSTTHEDTCHTESALKRM